MRGGSVAVLVLAMACGPGRPSPDRGEGSDGSTSASTSTSTGGTRTDLPPAETSSGESTSGTWTTTSTESDSSSETGECVPPDLPDCPLCDTWDEAECMQMEGCKPLYRRPYQPLKDCLGPATFWFCIEATIPDEPALICTDYPGYFVNSAYCVQADSYDHSCCGVEPDTPLCE